MLLHYLRQKSGNKHKHSHTQIAFSSLLFLLALLLTSWAPPLNPHILHHVFVFVLFPVCYVLCLIISMWEEWRHVIDHLWLPNQLQPLRHSFSQHTAQSHFIQPCYIVQYIRCWIDHCMCKSHDAVSWRDTMQERAWRESFFLTNSKKKQNISRLLVHTHQPPYFFPYPCLICIFSSWMCCVYVLFLRLHIAT